jgi:MFS family permease
MARRSPPDRASGRADRYRWVALSNTTLGMLLATLNASSLIIALPVIFRGIHLDPLDPGNFSYLLWVLMGYLLVSAVLVVTLGRVGDMFGRVRMFRLGFVVFTAASVALSLTWSTGAAGAIELIAFRMVQAVGGALLMANAAAILTDAFPADQRGMALGVNQIAGLAGSFAGLLLGGVLAAIDWRWVFLVNVPVGVLGTVWAYRRLRETGAPTRARIDWLGNLTLAAGLTMVLTGIIYGIKPYGTAATGWGNPFVLAMLVGGVAVLALFALVERRVEQPMLDLRLFSIRPFTMGNLAALLASIGRGGFQFMLIIWLQGIWLPLHGYDFDRTPLWAGIYLTPLTVGFLVAGPLSGWLSDRFGARPFATGGMLLAAASFLAMATVPANFSYPVFAAVLLVNGLAFGMFASPNLASVMNSVPARHRGAASGTLATFQNAGFPLSIGLFFSLMVLGLQASVPHAMLAGLTAHGVPLRTATTLSQLPPLGYLFAAFLGYNPLGTLLGPKLLAALPPGQAAQLTGRAFFPQLISDPFRHGLVVVLAFAALMCLGAAAASWARGRKFVHEEAHAHHAAAGPQAQEPASLRANGHHAGATLGATEELRPSNADGEQHR